MQEDDDDDDALHLFDDEDKWQPHNPQQPSGGAATRQTNNDGTSVKQTDASVKQPPLHDASGEVPQPHCMCDKCVADQIRVDQIRADQISRDQANTRLVQELITVVRQLQTSVQQLRVSMTSVVEEVVKDGKRLRNDHDQTSQRLNLLAETVKKRIKQSAADEPDVTSMMQLQSNVAKLQNEVTRMKAKQSAATSPVTSPSAKAPATPQQRSSHMKKEPKK